VSVDRANIFPLPVINQTQRNLCMHKVAAVSGQLCATLQRPLSPITADSNYSTDIHTEYMQQQRGIL